MGWRFSLMLNVHLFLEYHLNEVSRVILSVNESFNESQDKATIRLDMKKSGNTACFAGKL